MRIHIYVKYNIYICIYIYIYVKYSIYIFEERTNRIFVQLSSMERKKEKERRKEIKEERRNRRKKE